MKQRKLTQLVRLAIVPVVSFSFGAMSAVAADDATKNKSQTNMSSDTKRADETHRTQNYRAVRASKMIGMNVINREGKNVGEVKDVIVNMNTGDVRYAVLSFGGFLGLGDKLFAVPVKEFKMAVDKEDLILDVNKERLEKSKGFDPNNWPTDRAYWNEADRIWGAKPVQTQDNARAYRVSQLIGKDVLSRDGKDIGDIKDLVINMNTQKVHYAVLGFDPSWTTPEKLYAFPLRAFRLAVDKDDVVLEIDRSRLQAMRSLNDWNEINNPKYVVDIDRYFVTIFPAQGASSGLFGQLDKNKDGYLSRDEARADAGVMRAWNNLDRDNDGRVSRDDFMHDYQPSGSSQVSTK